MTIYETGSSISFIPDHSGAYHVEFSAPSVLDPATGEIRTYEPWNELIIGWSLVFHHIKDESGEIDPPYTRLEPVVLDDGRPSSMTEYLDVRGDGVIWRVVAP